MTNTEIIVSMLAGLAFTFAVNCADAQDVKVTTVKAAGKTVECVQVTKTLTVCTMK